MSRLTLRLPESLHRELEEQARQERVSLNQYLVYALTRYSSAPDRIIIYSEEDIKQQRTDYDNLLRSLRRGTPDEIRAAMDEAEQVQPEPDLDPDLVGRLRFRINEAGAEYQTKGADA